MDLMKHYVAYRNAVSSDALEGFIEKAKATPTSNPGQSVHDYLTTLVKAIQTCIENGNEVGYRKNIELHQKTVISLFRRMVDGLIANVPDETQKKVTLLDEGYNWIMFSNMIIEFDTFRWIPRYSLDFKQHLHGDKPVLSTREMRLVSSIHGEVGKAIIERKSKEKALLVFTGLTHNNCVEMFHSNHINSGGVIRDWTMQLFQEIK